jgi:hypothetical protein
MCLCPLPTPRHRHAATHTHNALNSLDCGRFLDIVVIAKFGFSFVKLERREARFALPLTIAHLASPPAPIPTKIYLVPGTMVLVMW